MTTYTYAQLEQLWINNGGSSATAPLAAAIAEAESSGNPGATSGNPDGGTNVGLWQLDTPGGGGAGYTAAQLADPNTNAAVAVKVSSGGSNWSTWETYVTGAYKAFLSGSTTPDPSVPAASATPATTAAATTADTTGAAGQCVIAFPALNVVVTTLGGGCILSKSEARALIGGAVLAAAGLMGLVAVLVIAASAFDHSGAASALAKTAAAVPGAAPGTAAVRAAARPASSPGTPGRAAA